MMIPLLEISETAGFCDIQGGIVFESPFKGILIKCLLEALNYIKITQQNTALGSIIVPVSCVKSDRFILSVKTVHLDFYILFSFYTWMLQRTVLRQAHFSREVNDFARINEFTRY